MILKVTLALLSWSAVTLAKPQGGQLVQPEWNWQEVGKGLKQNIIIELDRNKVWSKAGSSISLKCMLNELVYS